MDYFSILYPAVAALNPNNPQTRAAVYNRARAIVANRTVDSAAANAAISDELLSLEKAIHRLEAEFVARDAVENEEWEPEPLPSVDLEPRSGWLWKAAAAASIVGALAVAAVFAFPSFWPAKKPPTVMQTDEMPAAIKPQDFMNANVTNGDNRPYTLRRQLVYYRSTHAPGAVVISKSQKFLYLIRPNVSALRYSIAVGGKCADSVGLYQVLEKEEFPGWNESAPGGQAETLSPLLSRNANPLGARALYLEKNERIIHGISRVAGPGSSLGCFQLLNEDVIDLYERVPVGTRVVASN